MGLHIWYTITVLRSPLRKEKMGGVKVMAQNMGSI